MSEEQFSAKVIAASSNGVGVVLTTLQLMYPRFIHAEFMTHRMFSRNASSSRAIPVAKMIKQVRDNPAMPIHWGANEPGMKARQELADTSGAIAAWRIAAQRAADDAEGMKALGLHKQVANRVLEPFQLMHVIVTATEWGNFLKLRNHPDAQPEIQRLAEVMQVALVEAAPIARPSSGSPIAVDQHAWSWHLPYISEGERNLYRLEVLLKASTARCARVSYMNHDGSAPLISKDIGLHDMLVAGEPVHASPTEHQAMSADNRGLYKNFRGWRQYREVVEGTAWRN
jgi:hypothetical protein